MSETELYTTKENARMELAQAFRTYLEASENFELSKSDIIDELNEILTDHGFEVIET